ncbi:unnamed protein product [Bathycoccus prasinos]
MDNYVSDLIERNTLYKHRDITLSPLPLIFREINLRTSLYSNVGTGDLVEVPSSVVRRLDKETSMYSSGTWSRCLQFM